MLGLTAPTWTLISTVFGLIGLLLLFRYGMPGRVQTGGQPLVVANITAEDQVEEKKYMLLGYLGLVLTIIGALCNVIAAYS